jgi:hypothetical protein
MLRFKKIKMAAGGCVKTFLKQEMSNKRNKFFVKSYFIFAYLLVFLLTFYGYSA